MLRHQLFLSSAKLEKSLMKETKKLKQSFCLSCRAGETKIGVRSQQGIVLENPPDQPLSTYGPQAILYISYQQCLGTSWKCIFLGPGLINSDTLGIGPENLCSSKSFSRTGWMVKFENYFSRLSLRSSEGS